MRASVSGTLSGCWALQGVLYSDWGRGLSGGGCFSDAGAWCSEKGAVTGVGSSGDQYSDGWHWLSDASGTWFWGLCCPAVEEGHVLPRCVLPCTQGRIYGSQPSQCSSSALMEIL